jgi:hypothetical protein
MNRPQTIAELPMLKQPQTEATTKYSWPAGETMDVVCPNCTGIVATQISVVRDDNLPLRPEDQVRAG